MTGMNDEGRRWYVVNTYSGHENKVKENLEKRVESMGLQDVLFQIVIPEHVETEIKDGKKINKTKNMFPGYVLVEMIMTDEAWYVVRNTSGVTGFIGSSGGGAKPFPLPKSELDPILKKMGLVLRSIRLIMHQVMKLMSFLVHLLVRVVRLNQLILKKNLLKF